MIFLSFMNVLSKPLLNGYILLNRRHNVYSSSLKQNRMFRLSEGTGLLLSTYVNNPPSHSFIRRWHKKFMETRSVLDVVVSGQPRTSAENSKSVRQAFSRPPMMNEEHDEGSLTYLIMYLH